MKDFDNREHSPLTICANAPEKALRPAVSLFYKNEQQTAESRQKLKYRPSKNERINLQLPL
uniref:hypothetical protein n=1 Tax=Mariniflexile sp. TaxID=1979402 RepID=UPI00404858E4